MTAAIYIFSGLLLSLIPLLMKISAHFKVMSRFDTSFLSLFEKNLAKIALISLGIFFLILKNNLFFASCCVSLALFLSYKNKKIEWKMFIISLLFLLASSKLLWWYNEGLRPYEWQRSAAFLLFSITFLKTLCQPSIKKMSPVFLSGLFIFALIAAFFSFNTGLYTDPEVLLTTLHHWGAYIGPSQMMEAGARVLYDIPTQYGLGPNALLTGLYQGNFWLKMYYLNGITILLYTSLLAGCILVIKKDGNVSETLIFILACFVTAFFWTGYPPTATFTPSCPSVTGLRFTPIALLALFLLLKATGYKYFQLNTIFHLIWCFGFLWSPESAFYVTFVWWPYYLLLKYQDCEHKKLIPVVLQAMVPLAAWLLSLLCAFISIYYIAYGVFPSAKTYLLYAIYPPGPLPISPKGAVWFFLSVIALGIVAIFKAFRSNPDKKEAHYLFITILMTYAVSSYFFLGRSHSNNILNLTPLMLISLVAMHSVFKTNIGRTAVNILIVSLISYSPFFGWQSIKTSLEQNTLLQFNPSQLVDNLADLHKTMTEPYGSDVENAINFIQSNFKEPLLVMNRFYNLKPYATDDVWSALHGFANFTYVPVKQRRIYLWDIMIKLQKPGWLVAEKGGVSKPWLEDYNTAYIRTQAVDFGSHYAIRFIPRVSRSEVGTE